MLEKTVRMNALYDFYHPLLTEKQKKYMELYYRDDYSLGEISSHFQVSRQAVYDNIKRTESLLEEYETKLSLYDKYTTRMALYDELKQVARSDSSLRIKEIVESLEQLEEEGHVNGI
ncbi:putative DNA-binding protein [Aliibacillus thermotolerans]|uniref:UPF0122 protein ACFPTR_03990 n=1 Tax=Aliibacillus thermotolerans TaxID=1834418 RepID=A0ABW0U4J0_9BACI|nr:putative DNA-binding protein [Aliibacillus thermotolerans]MDA3130643.1 putative DNA-binding protein [Aliibacillus thermotolerans]